jgi:VIT1/CCC1 family predicted Fe2+/Mn2+ transporter
MLLYSAGAVVLFWVAHVYAAILAHGPAQGGSLRAELDAVRREAASTLPLVEACLAPAIPLVIAMLGLLALPLAYAASLTIGIVTLAAVGFVAVHNRGASIRRALAVAVTTGGLGASIIAAETFWH